MAAFTTRFVEAIKPAPAGKRTMHWDDGLRSFGIRVSDKGSASYVVMRRVNGKLIRHVIGRSWKVPGAPSLSLAQARDEARAAICDMTQGLDPRATRAVSAATATRHKQSTFDVVAEDFIAGHVVKLRTAKEVSAAIRHKLVPVWGELAINEITRSDVIRLIREHAKDHPHAAQYLLAYVRRLFGWAIAQDVYGLQASPCVAVSASALIGELKARDRVLTDTETRQVWQAAVAIGYPFGDLARFLLLTGQRLRECAEATRDEIDLQKRLWSIPASRMKNDAPHEVPLSPASIDLLTNLPTWNGKFLFSTMDGNKPVSGFSKGKRHLDGRLGDLPAWRFHDLRRTVRTQLGALGVPTNISELVIGHAQPGLHRTYDRYRYLTEKRSALETWADRLAEIVEPAQVRQPAE